MKEKHGDTGTKLHNTWNNMRYRCNRKTHKMYPSYGGRGINVCELWNTSYPEFKRWALSNGFADHLTLDRIDNNKGYYAANCRWASPQIQSYNTRKDHRSEHRGVRFNKHAKKYRAQVVFLGKSKHIGSYNRKEDAIVAYDKFVLENNIPIPRNAR